MSTPLRALLVEDSEDDALLVLRQLRQGGYEVTSERVQTAQAMSAALARDEWDIVIADYSMPRFSGLEALELLRKTHPDMSFLFVSGTIGEEAAAAAMRQGAQDYIMKSNLRRLTAAVEREIREAEVRRERRRLEAQLLHSQKMEAIGRLAGGLAHDFNNLLSVIMGYSEIVLSNLALGDPHRWRIEEIQKAAQRGASLTRQLLAFSRKHVYAPRLLDLNALLQDMERMLRRLIGEHIRLTTSLAASPARIKVDAGQIEQVVMNLVVNARDAMEAGGGLTLETRNVRIEDVLPAQGAPAPGPYVLLSVTDTGIGMTPEIQTRIFEPFFTTKEEGKGTGLGLATAYGIVRQSGGHIAVASAPGQGTTFDIYLPQVEGTEEQAVEVSAGSPTGTETILLLEDERAVRRMLRTSLEGCGYEVLMAGDIAEAMEVCRLHDGPIHLLITDVIMPGSSGRTVAQQLRGIYPDLKVLYVSGYAAGAIPQEDLVDTGIDFLQKPFPLDALARRVRELLDAPR